MKLITASEFFLTICNFFKLEIIIYHAALGQNLLFGVSLRAQHSFRCAQHSFRCAQHSIRCPQDSFRDDVVEQGKYMRARASENGQK